jgi:hypothetical protein
VRGGGRAATSLIAACGVSEGSDRALELVGKARGVQPSAQSAYLHQQITTLAVIEASPEVPPKFCHQPLHSSPQ